jgi:uncharacterized membrane protein YfcA
MPAHPFPSLNWDDVKAMPTLICCVALFLGAVLCSAGGIGGGGVYVTVLMVAGQLSPHDAVPLSKAVVFFGSLSSLFLNVKKTLAMQEVGQPQQTLIDYNICRIVVPAALLGTLLGVLLNGVIASWLIVFMLSFILTAMSYMSIQKFIKQHYQEMADMVEASARDEARTNDDRHATDDAKDVLADVEKESSQEQIRGILVRGEGFGAFFLLLFVIACGVFRQHAENCRGNVWEGKGSGDACVRPIMKIFFGGSLCTWMADRFLSQLLPALMVAVPACICVIISLAYSRWLVRREGWQSKEVAVYSGMALLTGCFAGLVGIGGGLIFAPFMLWMGVDPSIAVATSSTCVIFTSSSTTMQYLFTDRIILSLALIYGVVSSTASYVGTSSVHLLQEKHATRQSYITGVVTLGVLASVVLSIYKLTTIGIGGH